MSAHQRYMQYRKNELYHFNQYHDKASGRFTSSLSGQSGSSSSEKSRISFDSDGTGTVSYGNNPKAQVVIEDGGSRNTALKIVNDQKIEKKLRDHAAENLYDPQIVKSKNKDEYKKHLICQQINVGKFRDPVGDGSQSDVTVWYGEDPDGSGWMMEYNSETNKIVYSQYYR